MFDWLHDVNEKHPMPPRWKTIAVIVLAGLLLYVFITALIDSNKPLHNPPQPKGESLSTPTFHIFLFYNEKRLIRESALLKEEVSDLDREEVIEYGNDAAGALSGRRKL